VTPYAFAFTKRATLCEPIERPLEQRHAIKASNNEEALDIYGHDLGNSLFQHGISTDVEGYAADGRATPWNPYLERIHKHYTTNLFPKSRAGTRRKEKLSRGTTGVSPLTCFLPPKPKQPLHQHYNKSAGTYELETEAGRKLFYNMRGGEWVRPPGYAELMAQAKAEEEAAKPRPLTANIDYSQTLPPQEVKVKPLQKKGMGHAPPKDPVPMNSSTDLRRHRYTPRAQTVEVKGARSHTTAKIQTAPVVGSNGKPVGNNQSVHTRFAGWGFSAEEKAKDFGQGEELSYQPNSLVTTATLPMQDHQSCPGTMGGGHEFSETDECDFCGIPAESVAQTGAGTATVFPTAPPPGMDSTNTNVFMHPRASTARPFTGLLLRPYDGASAPVLNSMHTAVDWPAMLDEQKAVAIQRQAHARRELLTTAIQTRGHSGAVANGSQTSRRSSQGSNRRSFAKSGSMTDRGGGGSKRNSVRPAGEIPTNILRGHNRLLVKGQFCEDFPMCRTNSVQCRPCLAAGLNLYEVVKRDKRVEELLKSVTAFPLKGNQLEREKKKGCNGTKMRQGFFHLATRNRGIPFCSFGEVVGTLKEGGLSEKESSRLATEFFKLVNLPPSNGRIFAQDFADFFVFKKWQLAIRLIKAHFEKYGDSMDLNTLINAQFIREVLEPFLHKQEAAVEVKRCLDSLGQWENQVVSWEELLTFHLQDEVELASKRKQHRDYLYKERRPRTQERQQ